MHNLLRLLMYPLLMFKLLAVLFLITFSLSTVAEPKSSVSLSFKDRDDIDYRTKEKGIALSTITPIGLVGCSFAETTGTSRINSFNNIFSLKSLLVQPWLNYKADKITCKYGVKAPVAGGTLKTELGYQDYDGQTERITGGKDINATGKSVAMTYEKGLHSLRMKHARKDVDGFIRYSNYDSTLDTNKSITELSYSNPELSIHLEDTDGDKNHAFTSALIPDKRFSYRYQTLEIGKTFQRENGDAFFVAPIFINGSQAGTFNPLQTDNILHGVHLKYLTDKRSYAFKIFDFEGKGDRAYSPVTDRLYEVSKSRHYQFEYIDSKWKVMLENLQTDNTGTITISSSPYTVLAGGAGTYNNKREINKWELNAEYAYTEQLSLLISHYQNRVSDYQYNFADNNYTEKAFSLGVKYKF